MRIDRPATPQSPACRPLAGQGVISVTGADAVSFLQGQLTHDLRTLGPESVLDAAYQTPQGRVIAVLRVLAHPDGCLLLLPRALASAVAARLSRYTLRAKARVADASAAYASGAVFGASYEAVCADFGVRASAAQRHAHSGTRHLVDRGAGRTLILAPHEPGTAATAGSDADADTAWAAAGIAAGDPEISPPTTEAYTAHMLNLDLVDAVSFSKGCYAGQEIVARTQHLGRVKRRMFRYVIAATDTGGTAPLTALYFGDTKVGEIAASAPAADHVECLAVVSLEARDLGLRTADGVELTPAPLPYAVP